MDPSWVWVVGVLFSKKSGIDARWILQHVFVFLLQIHEFIDPVKFSSRPKTWPKTPKSWFSKGSPWLFQKNLGWWNKIIWPDQSCSWGSLTTVKCWNFRDFFSDDLRNLSAIRFLTISEVFWYVLALLTHPRRAPLSPVCVVTGASKVPSASVDLHLSSCTKNRGAHKGRVL